MNKIKVGFVGAGYMGQLAHLSNYAVLNECEVVAIAEPRPLLCREVASRYGVKYQFKDHIELLENCEVDAIVAVQWYANHVNIIPDILNAKKHLFTEKPLCISVDNGEKMVRLADSNGVLHMIGYHKRSDPAMEYAKKLIDEWKQTGEYGKMRLVRITMPNGEWTGGAGKALTTDESYPELKFESLPDYFDMETGKKYDWVIAYYIHQINALRFLFGEPYRVTFADKSRVLMAVESKSGVCGTIEMAPYNTSVDWEESVLVGFDKGFIKVDFPAPLAVQQCGRVIVMKDNCSEPPSVTEPIMPRISAMRNQAMNFLAAVRGERSAPCVSSEALEDLKIAKEYITLLSSRT